MNEKYTITNQKLRGRLPSQLRMRRERGDSYQDIAFWLRGKGVKVSHETVRQWYLESLEEGAKHRAHRARP